MNEGDRAEEILDVKIRHRPFLHTTSPVLLEAKQLLILAFYSILGVLARKGMTVLTTFNGAYVGGILWANFTSCFIMGLLLESTSAWDCFFMPREADFAFAGASKKSEVKLYVGLTTGFCGSFSSFSTWILDMFLESANLEFDSLPFRNAGGYGIMQFFSVLIVQLSVSLCAFQFGKNVVQWQDPLIVGLEILEDLSVLAGGISWIAVICLMAVKNWRGWMFSCVVSPIACWLRYYLARNFNPRQPLFPQGTFIANVLATITLSVFYLVNRGKTPNGRILNSVLSCQLVQGLEDGFSGTLSTVSTFVVELYSIKSFDSYLYGFISVISCFCLMVIILGSYSWTQGLVDTVC